MYGRFIVRSVVYLLSLPKERRIFHALADGADHALAAFCFMGTDTPILLASAGIRGSVRGRRFLFMSFKDPFPSFAHSHDFLGRQRGVRRRRAHLVRMSLSFFPRT